MALQEDLIVRVLDILNDNGRAERVDDVRVVGVQDERVPDIAREANDALELEMPKYGKAVGRFDGFTEMGVFWDWAGLDQKDPALFDRLSKVAQQMGSRNFELPCKPLHVAQVCNAFAKAHIYDDVVANLAQALKVLQEIRPEGADVDLELREIEAAHAEEMATGEATWAQFCSGPVAKIGAVGVTSMLLQQLGGQKAGQSPDMVYGVVKQMKATFSEDLEDMRTQEATASERHEGLVDAKSQEIAALKKQLMDKKSRLAKSKVQGANRAQQKERSEKLLDAQSEVLGSMRELCQRNEESFEARDRKSVV